MHPASGEIFLSHKLDDIEWHVIEDTPKKFKKRVGAIRSGKLAQTGSRCMTAKVAGYMMLIWG
jgi:hypothetical protein